MLKHTLLFWFFTFLSLDSFAQVSISPQNPIAGQPVQLYYQGCEPPYPTVESGELFYTERSEGLVQFVGFYTFSLPLCPFWYQEYYDLGTFEEGDYELDAYYFLGIDPLPIDLSLWIPNEIISFSVSGTTEPQSVAFANKTSLFSLMSLIILMAYLAQRKEES